MTKIIIQNYKTGAFEIIERTIPYPRYNIGQRVSFENDKKEKIFGVITGMDISSHLSTDHSTFIFNILLTLDDGVHQIYEDQVATYYEDIAIKLPAVS